MNSRLTWHETKLEPNRSGWVPMNNFLPSCTCRRDSIRWTDGCTARRAFFSQESISRRKLKMEAKWNRKFLITFAFFENLISKCIRSNRVDFLCRGAPIRQYLPIFWAHVQCIEQWIIIIWPLFTFAREICNKVKLNFYNFRFHLTSPGDFTCE